MTRLIKAKTKKVITPKKTVFRNDKQLLVFINGDLKQEVMEVARENYETLSHIVRQALLSYVRKYKKPGSND